MKTIEIVGYKRANLGKSQSQQLRNEGYVPCVVYGGTEQVHFYAPMILFRDLVYTNEAHFVHLNIEGEESQAILQEIQFHPVSEIILHADFLKITEDRKITEEHWLGRKQHSPCMVFRRTCLITSMWTFLHWTSTTPLKLPI
jgi:large subunit ribosomal protein L25